MVSKASGRSFSTTHSGRIYTYLYGKTVYIRLIRHIYTPAKIHIRCIRIWVRRNFIHKYVYIRYVYIRRIYTYTVWANPKYIWFIRNIRIYTVYTEYIYVDGNPIYGLVQPYLFNMLCKKVYCMLHPNLRLESPLF